MDAETKCFSIFRAGVHTDMHGDAASYSADDVATMATVFDEQTMPAPVVIGHPLDNRPAYGLVRKLFARAGVLVALADCHPVFVELVRAGRFKNRSASFYKPDAVANPVPGAWYLRHVGFLGAAAPAVKGLGDPNFGAGPDGAVSFGDSEGGTIADCAFAVPNGGRDYVGRMKLHWLALEMQMACPTLEYVEAVAIAEESAGAVTCRPTRRG